ncbi:AbgT family transporter [Campylobacter jejuni]|nr:AbgT family transporter [Campylobacter jejuni]
MNLFLKNIENLGNKIPDVSILFFFALVIVLFASYFLSFFDFNYFLIKADGSGSEQVVIKNFLSLSNFLNLLSKMTINFINFPPLGVTLVVALAIGIAETSGFLRVSLIKLSLIIPKILMVPVVLIISVASHIIGDGAYVFLMPIVAMLFISVKKHPVAGIATAFAGLAGGFSASFTPSLIDPIMQGFTEKAARILDSSYNVNVLCNYFVSLAGTVSVILFCWFVCDKIIEPYLTKNLPLDGSYEGFSSDISRDENRGFIFAILSILFMIIILVILAYPSDSLLRGSHGSLSEKDAILMKGLVAFLFLFFAIPGLVFGIFSKKFTNLTSVIYAMSDALKPLISFMVFCFICGQFLYVFNESNISKLLAVSGAEFLKSLSLPREIIVFGVIVFTGFLNLFVTSATSKWAVLAPIFVPMLMLVGISPELTQAAFRVSDSAINVMTPLFPFYPLIIAYCQKYSSKTGVGTLCSVMIPYSIALMIALTLILYLFWTFNIPLGFESSYIYTLKR